MNKQHRKTGIKSYLKSKNNIIHIKLNKSKNCCLYFLKSKDLVHIKWL